MKKINHLPPLNTMATINAQRMLQGSSRSKTKRSATQDLVERTRRPRSKVARLQQQARDEEDKENVFRPLCGSTPHSNKMSKPGSTPLIKSDLKGLSWSLKKVLTPIKEEKLDQSMNIRCLPKNFLTPKATGLLRRGSSKSKEKSNKVKRLEQYFVTSERRSASYDNLVVNHGRTDSVKESVECNRVEECSSRSQDLDLSDDIVAVIGGVPVTLSPMDTSKTPRKQTSLGQSRLHEDTAASDITVNGPMSLKDISQISQVSSPHEQASSANLSGAFHSTFQYPLHSTFNYPLHSSFNFSTIVPTEKKVNRTSAKSTGTSKTNHVNLCKEHGIHPSTGRPCIFQNDESCCSFDESANCTEIDVDEYDKTFCNSSYLSEDTAEENILMFKDSDHSKSRACSMKGLRRQAGLGELTGTTDSFFGLGARIISLDEPDSASDSPSKPVQPSVLTTLPSCSEGEEDETDRSRIPHGHSLMSKEPSCSLYPKQRTVNKHRAEHPSSQRVPGDGEHSSKRQYARNCKALSSRHVSSMASYSQQGDSSRSYRAHRRQVTAHSKDSASRDSRRSSRHSSSSRHSQNHREQNSQEWDSAYSSQSHSEHFTISDNTGCQRRIVVGASSSASMNLSHEQKRALAKKLKHFSNSYNSCSNDSKMQIQTLGHF